MISMNSGTPSSASPGCSGADAPVTPSASQRCTDTSWAWCRPTAPAVWGSGHQAQHGASGPASRRAPSSEYVHQPIQASRSASSGKAVSAAPERSSAFWARTFSPQYHCTSPMWWARSRTDHSGVVGTLASRSSAATVSAMRRLSAAMISSRSPKPKCSAGARPSRSVTVMAP